jgi:hypothetical protein
VEFTLFRIKTHRSSRMPSLAIKYKPPRTRRWHPPHFPFSHISSEIPLFRIRTWVTRPSMETTNDQQPPERRTRPWRIPKWLAASGLAIGKQSTSFNLARTHHRTDGPRLQRQCNQSPGPIPLESGFPHSRIHQLDVRRPSQPLKRPTEEASKPKVDHSSPRSTPIIEGETMTP